MKQYAAGMKVKPDALSLQGYRLPTEAEWEFACRAGVADARYYGETKELLVRHAWYTTNSHDKKMTLPGSFRPNDLGLFDLLGNALEWCEDPAFFYPSGTRNKPKEDIFGIRDLNSIDIQTVRVLRGGSFSWPAQNVRSANRYFTGPAVRFDVNGFRPARTYR
jgi:formylglycine-generating enzyme required for sulfatase activity